MLTLRPKRLSLADSGPKRLIFGNSGSKPHDFGNSWSKNTTNLPSLAITGESSTSAPLRPLSPLHPCILLCPAPLLAQPSLTHPPARLGKGLQGVKNGKERKGLREERRGEGRQGREKAEEKGRKVNSKEALEAQGEAQRGMGRWAEKDGKVYTAVMCYSAAMQQMV